MKHRVFVDGQEGTTGLRIHEYLAQREDIEVLRIDPELRKETAERDPEHPQVVKVTEAELIFVAIDREGKPRTFQLGER